MKKNEAEKFVQGNPEYYAAEKDSSGHYFVAEKETGKKILKTEDLPSKNENPQIPVLEPTSKEEKPKPAGRSKIAVKDLKDGKIYNSMTELGKTKSWVISQKLANGDPRFVRTEI